MVAAVRRGASLRTVAGRFHVSLLTVQRWVKRSNGQRLDRVDWSDRPSIAHTIHRTAAAVEDTVLTLRRELRETSDLGEYGAAAIHRELLACHYRSVPAVRTIGRILERSGALDGRRRVRRPPPPRGWYLPEVAASHAELDSFDIVEGLVIKGGTEVEVLNGISLHGGLVASWPGPPVRARTVVEVLVAHWRQFGLPAYAQFDNDTRFQGAHQFPDTVGRVTRLCLSLGVVPVFAPPRETGFQAAVESYNGRWQAKVWARFHHPTLTALRERSDRYVAAARQRAAARVEAAPPRRSFPKEWELDLQTRPRGRLLFLRRTSEQGTADLLGHTWRVDTHWPHRLVRAEVDFDANRIRFYALRRHEPQSQPLLQTVRYRFPRHGFQE
ncbi:MAG: hypothetical protein IH876_05980 [Gemmatimonadetes bacterium]|nr:hypothetical protein [Gemmatimonadota bacterium]